MEKVQSEIVMQATADLKKQIEAELEIEDPTLEEAKAAIKNNNDDTRGND